MVVKKAKKLMAESDDMVEAQLGRVNIVDDMAASETGKDIGSLLFMVGFIIALLAGLVAGLAAADLMTLDFNVGDLTGLLVIIGVIVGLVNVSSKESLKFLVAAIAIMVTPAGFSAMASATSMNVAQVGLSSIAAFLAALSGAIATFVAPAAVIVAVKVVYSTARKA